MHCPIRSYYDYSDDKLREYICLAVRNDVYYTLTCAPPVFRGCSHEPG